MRPASERDAGKAGGRLGRPGLAVLLVIALLAGLFYGAHVLWKMWSIEDEADHWPDGRPPSLTEAEIQEQSEAACAADSPREACYAIEVDGRTFRYSLLPPKGEAEIADGAPVTIYDPGGPGVSILSGEYRLSEVQENIAPDTALLAIEEPWVTAEVSEECTDSLSEVYDTVRTMNAVKSSRAAELLRVRCELAEGARFGFSPAIYANVVEQIVGRHRLELEAFVGSSFASMRLAYLGARDIEFGRAILLNPFPWGADVDEINSHRAQMLRSMSGAEVVLDRSDEGGEIAGRSVPVSEFDFASAVVEFGYVPEGRRSVAAREFAGGESLKNVGAFSDELWQRFGVNSLSPGMLALWSEGCHATGESSIEPKAVGERIDFILWALAAPCDGERVRVLRQGMSVAAQADAWKRAQVDTCVVSAKSDSVTPASLVSKYFPHAHVVETDTASHASSLKAVRGCYDYFGSLDPGSDATGDAW